MPPLKDELDAATEVVLFKKSGCAALRCGFEEGKRLKVGSSWVADLIRARFAAVAVDVERIIKGLRPKAW